MVSLKHDLSFIFLHIGFLGQKFKQNSTPFLRIISDIWDTPENILIRIPELKLAKNIGYLR